jgi:hypothetical protein
VIVVLLTTVTLTAMTSTVTVAPARNPVPLIVTGVGRTVEPLEGEIAVTLGAAAGDGGVGPDGDCLSQATNPNANASSNTPRRVLLFMPFPSYPGSGKAP